MNNAASMQNLPTSYWLLSVELRKCHLKEPESLAAFLYRFDTGIVCIWRAKMSGHRKKPSLDVVVVWQRKDPILERLALLKLHFHCHTTITFIVTTDRSSCSSMNESVHENNPYYTLRHKFFSERSEETMNDFSIIECWHIFFNLIGVR